MTNKLCKTCKTGHNGVKCKEDLCPCELCNNLETTIDKKILELAKDLYPRTNDVNRHRALALVGQLLGWFYDNKIV